MNTQFKESFTKDLRKIRDKELLNRAKAIIETVEQAQSPGQIPNLERLKGWSKYYRMRVGDYRVGLTIRRGCSDLCSVLAPKGHLQLFPIGMRVRKHPLHAIGEWEADSPRRHSDSANGVRLQRLTTFRYGSKGVS
jgi:mRNA interferase RelE/StbE